MYDALNIASLVDEFNSVLVGGRIQQVLQPDPLTIGFEVYAQHRRRWLVASAHPEQARLLLSDDRVDGDAERVSPLLLLLRKYARRGRIVAVSQPRYERIVQVSIAKPLEADNQHSGDDESESLELTHTELYVELMGRRSNLVLTNAEGRILDAVKRVSPEMSRVRPIRPGMQYVPPPPQQKSDPLAATPASIAAAVRSADGTPLDRWLVSQFVAVSPQMATEIATRAEIAPTIAVATLTEFDAISLALALATVFAPMNTGMWSPVLYSFPDGRAVFSAIRLESQERRDDVAVSPMPSVSDAAAAAWLAHQHARTAESGTGRHAVRRERLLDEVNDARDRIRHRIESLREQEERAAAAEEWRIKGEMIYAYIADIGPQQRELHTPEGLQIELDPHLTPSQNAQEYFERYRKARSAEENLPAMIEQATSELAYLDQLRALVRLSETYDEIESIRLEWLAYTDQTPGMTRAARPRGARPAASARRPRSFRTHHGDLIFVGRTGQQNETVTFDIANPGDLWLHARNMPGAHVILRSSGTPVDDTIERAAALAAWYSDGRGSTSVPVDITERRHVRKIRGAGPGMVTYRNERTINVRPESEDALGLEPGR